MLESLANDYPPGPVASCPHGDAIAVLAGTGPPRRRPLRPGEWPNRMESGLALYHAGKAPMLVFTVEGEHGEMFGLDAVSDAPPKNLYILSPVKNTAAEAHAIAAAAKQRNWHRLVLVTSGFHMARAIQLVERAARLERISLAVIPFPADPQLYQQRAPGFNEFLPGITGVEYSNRAAKEILGMWACKLGD